MLYLPIFYIPFTYIVTNHHQLDYIFQFLSTFFVILWFIFILFSWIIPHHRSITLSTHFNVEGPRPNFVTFTKRSILTKIYNFLYFFLVFFYPSFFKAKQPNNPTESHFHNRPPRNVVYIITSQLHPLNLIWAHQYPKKG